MKLAGAVERPIEAIPKFHFNQVNFIFIAVFHFLSVVYLMRRTGFLHVFLLAFPLSFSTFLRSLSSLSVSVDRTSHFRHLSRCRQFLRSLLCCWYSACPFSLLSFSSLLPCKDQSTCNRLLNNYFIFSNFILVALIMVLIRTLQWFVV